MGVCTVGHVGHSHPKICLVRSHSIGPTNKWPIYLACEIKTDGYIVMLAACLDFFNNFCIYSCVYWMNVALYCGFGPPKNFDMAWSCNLHLTTLTHFQCPTFKADHLIKIMLVHVHISS